MKSGRRAWAQNSNAAGRTLNQGMGAADEAKIQDTTGSDVIENGRTPGRAAPRK